MVMVRIYVGVVVVGGVYSCAFPTAAASPWSMVMMLSIAIVVHTAHSHALRTFIVSRQKSTC